MLRPQGEFHVLARAQRDRPTRLPPGEVAIRGVVQQWQVHYGIERYFVPEGTETPDWNELTVRLKIGDDGAARIEQVFRNGVPWP